MSIRNLDVKVTVDGTSLHDFMSGLRHDRLIGCEEYLDAEAGVVLGIAVALATEVACDEHAIWDALARVFRDGPCNKVCGDDLAHCGGCIETLPASMRVAELAHAQLVYERVNGAWPVNGWEG